MSSPEHVNPLAENLHPFYSRAGLRNRGIYRPVGFIALPVSDGYEMYFPHAQFDYEPMDRRLLGRQDILEIWNDEVLPKVQDADGQWMAAGLLLDKGSVMSVEMPDGMIYPRLSEERLEQNISRVQVFVGHITNLRRGLGPEGLN